MYSKITKIIRKVWISTTRRKQDNEATNSKLARVLGLFDLISVGVGATLGLGVYVLAGSVAKNYAGPATFLSFLIGAIVSLFGGLCFAEFAGRVPRSGYAYAYCYAGVGELIAFIVGWYLIVATMLGSAGVASGVSSYINILSEKKITSTIENCCSMNVTHLAKIPDFLALVIIIVIGSLLSYGVRESATFNNISIILNLLTIIVTIIGCSIKADGKNWKIPAEDIPPEYKEAAGDGGFLPFGFGGVIGGASNCFFGFTGFDAPANCGEEAKNPKRDIPIAILTTLFIAFVIYCSVSTVLTLAWPYYLQHEEASFAYVFEQFGWMWVKWVVSVGAIFAMLSSIFGSMYGTPRIIYAMASDGLIFKYLAYVHPFTQTPLIATSVSGLTTGLMATVLEIDKLIDLLTIGTLFTYVVVASSVLVLRYERRATDEERDKGVAVQNSNTFETIINAKCVQFPNQASSIVANLSILLYVISAVFFCLILDKRFTFDSSAAYYAGLGITVFAMGVFTGILCRQPESCVEVPFKVPLVPFVPLLSIICNLFLMIQLNLFVWSGFLIWIGVGLLVYFFYGMRNSKQNIE